jgi:hypothetical protein
MPALGTLADVMRNQLLTTAVEVNTSTPFTRAKPLAESRVAVVTSAGLHLRVDRPFTLGDPTYRIIPSIVRADDILQSHVSFCTSIAPQSYKTSTSSSRSTGSARCMKQARSARSRRISTPSWERWAIFR